MRTALGIASLLIAGCSPWSGSDKAVGRPDTIEPAGHIREADSVVGEWVDAGRIPGAVLLVSRNGEVVFERAYGWAQLNEYGNGLSATAADVESPTGRVRLLPDPRSMQPETVFDLASVTKVMATTLAVMLLVDSGELQLDAPVQTYLPDFGDDEASAPSGDVQTSPVVTGAGKQALTIRHLLTHRSGLPQWQPIYYHADDPAQAYEYIRNLPLAWSVGTERHYSDVGFMLLGLIVERTAGRRLGEFLQERLYDPLGLTATEFRPGASTGGTPPSPRVTSPSRSRPAGPFAATSHGNPYERRMVHDLDFGYRIEGDPNAWDDWRHYTLAGEVNDGNAFHAFDGTAGHAGLFSTAADLQVLLQLILNRGEYGGRRYISAATVDSFLAPTGDGQALGWQVPDYMPSGSFVHSGFTGTYVLGVPTENLGVILLTNRQNLGVDNGGRYPDVDELQRSVARTLTQ